MGNDSPATNPAPPRAGAPKGPLPEFAAAFTRGQPTDPAGLGPHSEWVLTDARGGMAMGTVLGVPMRRYHALLCASLTPPVRRTLMLSAIDEQLHIPAGGQCREDLDAHLTPFQFATDKRTPLISRFLTSFTKHADSCQWVYSIESQAGKIRIRKTLTLAQRSGACRIEYEIESGIHSPEPDAPIILTLRPLLAMRDFHTLNHTPDLPAPLATDMFSLAAITEAAVEGVAVRRTGLDATLSLRGVHLGCAEEHTIWRGFRYHHETLRAQPDLEDLYCPCVFSARIPPLGVTSVSIEATIGDESTIDWHRAATSKRTRVRTSIDHALALAGDPVDPNLRDAIADLAAAGDDFIVDRVLTTDTTPTGEHPVSTSIIAGYPWFSDWGRDAMIALPGLLLTTGRFEEARQCLRTFAQARQHGLIPNRFDDAAGPAHYNTADAPLWFIHACAQWSRATGHPPDPELIEACDDIIHAYTQGTINRIALDPGDALIRAGDAHTQLTWMDALRGGVAFTPRHGKPIEINALWINALTARRQMGPPSGTRTGDLEDLSIRARRSMIRLMAQGPGGGMVDCLVPTSSVRSFAWRPSAELRPNQVFAISLPGVGLSPHLGRIAMSVVTRSLLTPVGLRTLDAGEEQYQPHYTGTMMDRDRAYHNGTVWPWLLGPYCEAIMRVDGFDDASRATARALMLGLAAHMKQDSVGQLFEIYDAQPDITGRHAPHGCPAQAWSIAEALRVLVMAADPSGASRTILG